MEDFYSVPTLLSGNSFGIYFKPLNETFNNCLFKYSSGVLLNFERDLIDEDDIEYALDIMALFNKFPQFHV